MLWRAGGRDGSKLCVRDQSLATVEDKCGGWREARGKRAAGGYHIASPWVPNEALI